MGRSILDIPASGVVALVEGASAGFFPAAFALGIVIWLAWDEAELP